MLNKFTSIKNTWIYYKYKSMNYILPKYFIFICKYLHLNNCQHKDIVSFSVYPNVKMTALNKLSYYNCGV